MRLLHTADWHLGRIFYARYLTEDQAHVLEHQFFDLLKDQNIDGILLAGDIYDRSVPPVEAVELWDSVITKLAMDYNIPLFGISGNHDGPERLEVGRHMLANSGVHIWGTPEHAMAPFTVQDEFGDIAICPMPFAEPRRIDVALNRNGEGSNLSSVANHANKSTKTSKSTKSSKADKKSVKTDIEQLDLFAESNNLAVDEAVDVVEMNSFAEDIHRHDYDSVYQRWSDYLASLVPKKTRKIALSHAFVAGGEVGGSERVLSVGGNEVVNPAVFRNFNYAALGHLHGSQRAGADYIRYSGSLLKYSFDESNQQKSFTIVDVDKKGKVSLEFIPIEAKRDVVVLRGLFADLLNDRTLQQQHKENYMKVELLDTAPIIDGMAKLRQAYPHCMNLELVGRMERNELNPVRQEYKNLNERQLFAQFAEAVWKEPLSQAQSEYINQLWDDINKDE